MMIKVALVLCAIVATSMVCAKDFEEQDALDTLLNLMLSEEVASPDAVALQGSLSEDDASPDDAVALQGWKRRAAKVGGRVVRRRIAHRGGDRKLTRTSRKVHRKILKVQQLCRGVGYSPEEARAQILAEIPAMKEEDISEEDLRSICAGAHALFR
ncbi:centrocin 1-like [Strongylocentrotus purpuratus]|uniref:Uncharacterized protein n=1 Tax=Strongylocentrotus purpuratus TaxID=7668 RepID=A0A7M7NP43_STRPU|nr:centrocin 1-like [Strongylocentrotus purpuratus]XP_030838495.1 centrocin 1-like [Strongylocentrotus purpuratus]|eukprot:XP_003727828.1 PREDICTED: uncharacterized protein LOC100888238 [Strongylocentrotus purpuratus]